MEKQISKRIVMTSKDSKEVFKCYSDDTQKRMRVLALDHPKMLSWKPNLNDYVTSKNFLPKVTSLYFESKQISPRKTPLLSLSNYYVPSKIDVQSLIEFISTNQKKQEKSVSPKESNQVKPKDLIGFRFGKRGWTCTECSNFNFLTRNKCNTCGKKRNIDKKKGGKGKVSSCKTLQQCRLDLNSDPANQVTNLD